MKKIEKDLKEMTQDKYIKYRNLNSQATSFFIGTSFTCALFGEVNIPIYLAGLILSMKLSLFLKNNEYKSKTYDELELYYSIYIKRICDMLRSLKLDEEPLQAYKFLTILYKAGDLSLGRKYSYSAENYKDVVSRGMLGSSVVTGNAVCRHVGYLIHDIMHELGYDTDIIFINSLKLDSIENSGIKYENNISTVLASIDSLTFSQAKKYDEYNFKFQKQDKKTKIMGNHLILGMNYKGRYILLDPTNDTCFYNAHSFDGISKVDKLFEDVKKHDESDKKRYKACDDTIIMGENYNIAILKQAFVPSDTEENGIKYEKGIKYDQMKAKLDRLLQRYEKPIYDFATAKEIYAKRKDTIDKFYDNNRDFYESFTGKILDLKK